MSCLLVSVATMVAAVHAGQQRWYEAPPLLPVVVASSEDIPDQACYNHSRLFLQALDHFHLWAVQMLDASAKLPEGFVDGDVSQLGHFDECLAVQTEEVRGQYCLLDVSFQPRDYTPPASTPDPFSLHYDPHLHVWEKLKVSVDRSKVRRSELQWALCLPASCSPATLQHVLDHEARLFSQKTGLEVTVHVPPSRCTVARPTSPFSVGEIVYCVVVAVLFLLFVTSTFYDLVYYREKESEAAEGTSKFAVLERMLLCFSLKRNFKGFTKVTSNHPGIDACDGMRFFFMLLVIVGHRLSMYNSTPTYEANKFEEMFHKVATGFLLNGTLLVDFFFFASSMLLAYHMSIYLEANRTINVVSIFIVRLLRLTPSYMLVVFFHATVLYRFGSGPLWQEELGLDRQRCSENWWTNMLYINNYVNADMMCMYQSWYLSVDTQMFAVCLLLVYVIARWPAWGYSVTAILGTVSLIVSFVTTWWQRAEGFLIPYSDVTKDLISSEYFHDIYVRTENRMAPSLIGMLTGIALCKARNSTFRLSKLLSFLSYTTALAVLSLSFMGSYFFHKPGLPYDAVSAGLYASFSRVGLTMSFASLAFIGTFADWKLLQRAFSWKPLRVLSRLTYGAYLLHTIGHFFDRGTRRISQQTTIFAGLWAVFGDITFAYIAAFVVMMLLESPVRAMEKLVFRRNKAS